MHAQASQMLQKADVEIVSLKAQIVHQSELLGDKAHDLAIKDYDAETKRMSAVGNIDPMSLQVIVRQMVSDMLQTELHPVLQRHAEIEAGLQQTMQPPQPPEGGDGGNGQMVQ